MGDRTHVILSVPKEYSAEAAKIYMTKEEDTLTGGTTNLWCCGFEEVNYGELGCLDKLRELGIAYDSDWERGSEYGPGCHSLRFTSDGEAVEKEVYEEEKSLGLSLLREILKNNTDPLVRLEHLTAVINNRHNEVSVLPWDNQVEYGKRYLARQLITNTT